mmetsp:Transcript_37384/g.83196  ORF Transcript_37384/g.83196 Transcript_37384/m.83196 type:complete len:326 (+) Transcript_37384:46-1023(+)|eukprot:CAMPEP_0202900330 /NCGR_PEP_ID=MMETSP1392-20130828/11139_1 /ASSEMBLY_ACC=CAM_ASM_000868 /TAXON_ID=225041 /ORGANISM="Chlamydomonas chlamydogama, Strain SAG 11-48b" /LENGTH=325 /DNA_ID=CAMNT_0049586699 /DNA_START=147 /DNA_END=1124 /DNA_ORIENTATION=-
MGLVASKAESSAPPPMPNFANLSAAAAQAIKDAAKQEQPNYLDLPPPVKYEDIQREVLMALKPDLFEGMRFEITKPLNQNFFLSHSLFMGNMELSTGGKQILKAPIGTYEFGANVVSEKFMMLGRVATDGRLSGRVKYDIRDWLGLKLHMQLSNDPGQSQVMVDTDVKGKDWNAQLKLGNPSFVGLNYFQSITPKLSAGGEFFWLQSNLKSGVGFALRHTDDKHVATMQVATTGILSLQYAHKVSDKITLATDFLWHWAAREATATVGYDCILRQCRLRGKVDTNGVVSAYVEERFSPGINFVLSAELDHAQGNSRFGFGVVAGE